MSIGYMTTKIRVHLDAKPYVDKVSQSARLLLVLVEVAASEAHLQRRPSNKCVCVTDDRMNE